MGAKAGQVKKPKVVAMRPYMVRLGDKDRSLIRRGAKLEGVSDAEFVRAGIRDRAKLFLTVETVGREHAG